HGRALVDSHIELPIIDTDLEILLDTDFIPFKNLNFFPIAMTAHILFSSIDKVYPTTISKVVIKEIIRKKLNFQGLLLTDDMSANMKALPGNDYDKCINALNSGCDIILHCNGDIEAMKKIVTKIPQIRKNSEIRLNKALSFLSNPKEINFDKSLLKLNTIIKNI
ncbi:beta-hexosaminidase, partial [Alphaproteobacteria bacterium]|nr:beta-hexosaminidase [Alphaproteobacteria bacterium]